MDYPPFQSPVDLGRAGNDGTLWLRLADEGGATRRWLILDPAGTPTGTLELPRGLNIPWVEGDAFLAIELDDFAIPWVVRYRLGAAPSR
jgi:hypothetical protein